MKTIEKECMGNCPKCGSEDIDYGVMEPVGERVVYSVKCGGCGVEFDEEYELVYVISYYKEEDENNEPKAVHLNRNEVKEAVLLWIKKKGLLDKDTSLEDIIFRNDELEFFGVTVTHNIGKS